MKDYFQTFEHAAKDLARNPLGIIALFILLVYGFACLVLGFTGKTLDSSERIPLVWFLVLFPIIVLCAFYRLVSKHHRKLYAPSDYQDEAHFLDQQSASLITQQPSTGPVSKDFEDLMHAGVGSVVVSQNEEAIKLDMKKRNLKSGDESERVLVRYLAIAQANLWFEKTYYLIFGSQIRLLKHLNESKKAVDKDFMNQHFAWQQQQFSHEFSSWTTDQYLAFLITCKLIEQTDQGYSITPEGSEFLTEMTRRGLAEGKVL